MAPNKIQIERSALGRVNSLGDLYDLRSDSFLSINIFNKPLPPELITVLKSPSTKTEFHFTNSTKEKLDMMKFDAELSLSFLCGMITVGGSAKFLDKNVNNSKFVHCVLSQTIQTQRETVNFALERIPDFVNMEALSEHVTHVVVGIQRGCNAFVDFCFQSDEETSERDIEGMLKGALRETLNCGQKQISTECSEADDQVSAPSSTPVLGGAGASAGGQYKKKNNRIMTGVKLEVFADIHSTTSSTPQTVEEGMAYIREIQLQMGNTAGEPGAPISYELLSLQELKRLLVNKNEPRTLCNELSKVTVERAKRILYEGEEQLLRLTAFAEKVRSHGKLIPKELLNKITSFEDDCTISNIEIREKVHHHVIEARGNKDRLESLHEVFKDFANSAISKSQIDTFLNKQEELVCLCEFLDQLTERKVTLIEKKKDYWTLKHNKSAYVLFFSAKDLVTDTKLWHDTVEHFFDLCAKVDQEGICAAVHSDVMKDLLAEEEIGQKPIIAVIEEKLYITRDHVEYCNKRRKTDADAKENLERKIWEEQLQR